MMNPKEVVESGCRYTGISLPKLNHHEIELIQRGTGRTAAQLLQVREQVLQGKRVVYVAINQAHADELSRHYFRLFGKGGNYTRGLGDVCFVSAQGAHPPSHVVIYDHAVAYKVLSAVYDRRDELNQTIADLEKRFYG